MLLESSLLFNESKAEFFFLNPGLISSGLGLLDTEPGIFYLNPDLKWKRYLEKVVV